MIELNIFVQKTSDICSLKDGDDCITQLHSQFSDLLLIYIYVTYQSKITNQGGKLHMAMNVWTAY